MSFLFQDRKMKLPNIGGKLPELNIRNPFAGRGVSTRIGIDLGLTRERIRQIKEKVFETLRKKKKLGKLKGLFN